MVAVDVAGYVLESLAAVDALEQRHLRAPDLVRVGRRDGEGRVVPGALPQLVAPRGEGPVLAAVVRTEEPPLLRLDQRVDPAAIRGGHRDADLPPDPLGQAVAGDRLPAVAAVARDVEAAAGAAALQIPGVAPGLPEAGEDDIGVRGVERHRRGAGVRVLLQHLLPGPAAVGSAIDPALGVGAEGVAEHRGEGDVRIGGMHDHLADLPLLCPDVVPGLAGVDRLVDAVARPHVAADVRLPRADVDDVGIGRGDGDRADRGDRLVVEDGAPVDAAVDRLPDAPRGGSGVVDVGVARHPRHPRHAPTPRRTDQPVLEPLELGQILQSGGRDGGSGGRLRRSGERRSGGEHQRQERDQRATEAAHGHGRRLLDKRTYAGSLAKRWAGYKRGDRRRWTCRRRTPSPPCSSLSWTWIKTPFLDRKQLSQKRSHFTPSAAKIGGILDEGIRGRQLRHTIGGLWRSPR